MNLGMVCIPIILLRRQRQKNFCNVKASHLCIGYFTPPRDTQKNPMFLCFFFFYHFNCFKMQNSVVLNMLIILCNHHCDLIPDPKIILEGNVVLINLIFPPILVSDKPSLLLFL